MNLLLDTHAWLWFVMGDARLSAVARAHIVDAAIVKFVSPASFWETAIKVSLGKLGLNVPYRIFMRKAIVGNGFRILHVSTRHTEHVVSLPFHHRDPFDSLLIAQAIVHGMPLLSNEARFDSYGVARIW